MKISISVNLPDCFYVYGMLKSVGLSSISAYKETRLIKVEIEIWQTCNSRKGMNPPDS